MEDVRFKMEDFFNRKELRFYFIFFDRISASKK